MRAQPAATSAHDPHPALAEAGPAKLARMSRVEPETPAQSMRPGLAEAGAAAAVPLLAARRKRPVRGLRGHMSGERGDVASLSVLLRRPVVLWWRGGCKGRCAADICRTHIK